MQKIFDRDKIQDNSLTSDYILNILIYRMPFCVTYTSYKLQKMVQFLLAYSVLHHA